jgi:signal transduction histidine kinase
VLDTVEDALAAADFVDRVEGPAVVDLVPAPDPRQRSGYYGSSPSSRSSAEWARRASSVRDNMASIETVQQQQNLSLLNNLSAIGSKVGSGLSGDTTPPVASALDDIAQAVEDQTSLAQAQLGPVKPIWVGDELVLARRVRRGERVEVHGAWMNWPALRESLQAEIEDLLPAPTLVAVPEPSPGDAGRLLATLPVRLDHGALPPPPRDAFSPVRTSIVIGWTVVLLGSGTVVALLLWSMALSERRAAFVSTVTHELRTPLTTFRMYTEMLGEKMVEAKRDRYIATLRTEAERLGHLVENVLTYARIENDRADRARETLDVQTLVERVSPHVQERADASGSALEVALDADSRDRVVEVDPAAVEQILLNLVDNAAKYAPSKDSPARIVLESVREGRHVRIAVRDYGPGVPSSEQRKIFEPFSKAKRDEAGTKPGVGLGLALCRRLARLQGGELTVEDAKPGARFVLKLPSRAP